MAKAQDQNAWETQQKTIEQAQKDQPELFVATQKAPHELFEHVGITNAPRDLPKGYFKYRPDDFIVEEIRPDGSVITVDGTNRKEELPDGEGTVYFDLTKVGVSTLDAANKIQEITGHAEKEIGYSGIKDALALTAQRMSIRHGLVNDVAMIDAPGTIIRNVHERKGVVTIGGLKGNRFTLVIRTPEQLDEEALEKRINQIKTKGIMNYFGVQRFGTPRFVAHLVGKAMLVDGPEAGVKTYMIQKSDFELPFFAQRRAEATKHWGDWKKMHEILEDLPYSFRHELEMLKALMDSNGHFKTTLEAVAQQASMWVRAYASFATNELLSEAEKNDDKLPDEIPQLLNPSNETLKVYKKRLQKDGLRGPMAALSRYKFIRVGRNPTMRPHIQPEIHSYKVIPEGLAICFSLPKGAYATTMLMYLFDSITGYPIPDWLNTNELDSKEMLGMGSLKEVKKRFAEDIDRIMTKKNEIEEEGEEEDE